MMDRDNPGFVRVSVAVIAALALAMLVLWPAAAFPAEGIAKLRITAAQQCGPDGCVTARLGLGSAVNIGRQADGTWVFLTAAHSFDMLRPFNFTDLEIRGRWVRVVKMTERAEAGVDIAIVGITDPTELRAARLAKRDTEPGDAIELSGCPEGGRIVVYTGTCTGRGVGRVNGPVVPGFSGGGVFNASGELVGIQWGGMPDGECHWTPITTIRPILASRGLLNSDQPHPPAVVAGTPSGDDRLADVFKRLDALESRIASVSLREGPAGPTGPSGPQGPPGPAGPSGTGCEAIADRVAALEAEIARLRAIETSVRVWRDDGTLAGESKTRLLNGESIDLRFNPRTVPGSADRKN